MFNSKKKRFEPEAGINAISGNLYKLKPINGSEDSIAGNECNGKFTQIRDDFNEATQANQGQYRDKIYWNEPKRTRVKRFRFVVCTLGIVGLAVSLMSRSMLYVAIVEMTKDISNQNETIEVEFQTIASELNESSIEREKEKESTNEDSLHFNWSVGETNFLLSAFFIGYAPTISLSGGIADKYGSMYPLLVCVASSAIINSLTPILATFSYSVLVASRILLGILQSALVPACYDLFNKWLTSTEMNFFVAFLRVLAVIGSMGGAILPGVIASLGCPWTYNFYIGGLICAIWALIWFSFATSTPQTNKWVESDELAKIMRKKSTIPTTTTTATIKLDSSEETGQKLSSVETEIKQLETNNEQERVKIPWLKIISNPSVLAFTLVKFTYNFGMDFLSMEGAIFLCKMHEASTETATLIVSIGGVMQLILLIPLGELSRYLVQNEIFGLSRTKWRKLFQGTANFVMAFVYLIMPIIGKDLISIACLFAIVQFCFMLGIGGEAMVPYDLSPKYPATIVGFANSFATLSGFILPSVASLVLGDNIKDPSSWNRLFLIISCTVAFGGLVFVTVLKAKPFLANERAKYDQARGNNSQINYANSSKTNQLKPTCDTN